MGKLVQEDPRSQGFQYERIGKATATQLPDQPCTMAWFKAASGNPTNVYLGFSSGVTVLSSAADTATTGMELDAGDLIGPVPIDNLNKIWFICDSTNDDLIIWGLT